jgi:hypothetical protein
VETGCDVEKRAEDVTASQTEAAEVVAEVHVSGQPHWWPEV